MSQYQEADVLAKFAGFDSQRFHIAWAARSWLRLMYIVEDYAKPNIRKEAEKRYAWLRKTRKSKK